MLKEFRADLHIHTCLSPCGDLMMLPTRIISAAKEKNLQIIGICDHNSTQNVGAVVAAGKDSGIFIFAGIEITSREEVHILGLFDTPCDIEKIQTVVSRNLTSNIDSVFRGPAKIDLSSASDRNNEELFGEQLVVDDNDTPLEICVELLLGATTLSVEEIVKLIQDAGGLAIASHIDRESFGILGQLGFVPDDLALDAMELSPRCNTLSLSDYNHYGYPLVSFSDAHYPEDIGKAATRFIMARPCVEEIRKCFGGIDGRSFIAYS